MDKYNLSKETLKQIAQVVAKYVSNQINPNSIYRKADHTSFGQHIHNLDLQVSISIYPNNTYLGNIDGGGSFSGNFTNDSIYINCIQTSNSSTIKI